MPRKQKKYHFIYKTSNLLNGKFYVGMHSTDNLEDGYVGSGKRLGYSIRKYGFENHKFEILEFLPSREELKKREAEVVNEEMLKHPLCMNLKFGGEGGWDHLNGNNRSSLHRTNAAKAGWEIRKNDPNKIKKHSDFHAERMKRLAAAGNSPSIGNRSFLGKELSDEHKRKIGEKNSKIQSGSGNSQFGTCWICNDQEVKRIKAEELQLWLDAGWRKGRKNP